MRNYGKILQMLAFAAMFVIAPGFAQNVIAQQVATNDAAASDSAGPSGVQVGKTYTREVHGDWELRCVRTEDARDPCQLYQLMRDAEGNSVAEITLFEFPAGQEAVAGATLAVPLGTLLTRQITIQVGAGAAKRYPFSWCATQGCYARIGLTDEDLATYKRGLTAKVIIVPFSAPNAPVELKLSLIGFTTGFAAVRANNLVIARK
ncbi:MAG: invasion associated locus B family protein [Paracoccaceae bacterium]